MISRASLAISLALFAPAFLGCGGSEEPARTEPAEQPSQTAQAEPTAEQPSPTAEAEAGGYPAEVEQNFITACEANGGSTSQCSCALDEVKKEFTFEEFKAEDEAARAAGGKPSQRITEAIAECR